ncbi:MAG TPA: tetratricopeptide repeat protein [Candidatus Binatia bacterium]|nr:tetratricopeptide repeat protein [Candidatus Binatia bacterium]
MAAVVALGALVVAAYATSLDAGFVLDNRLIVLEDPRVRALTVENLRLIFGQDYWWPRAVGGLYRPLTTLSFLLNHAVLGNADRPLGYHVVNVLLHWGNATLVYLLARRVMGRTAPAFFAAALFAVHPIATEAVTNIVGRSDLLATAAVLGGLLLHARAGELRGARSAGVLVALAAVAVGGLLAKESAALLLIAMLVYDLCVPGARARAAGWVVVLPAAALVWLVRASLYAGLPAAEIPFVDNPLVRADGWSMRLTALAVTARYVWRLVWPVALSPDYSFAQIPVLRWPADVTSSAAVAGVLIVGAIVVGALAARRRRPDVAFFAVLFLVGTLPAASFVRPIGTIMAERLMYLPLVGFAGCVALGLDALGALLGRRVAIGLLALLLLAYGARTALRNRDWHDEVSLWTAAVRTSPGSFRTHRMLAAALAHAETAPYPSLDRVIAEAERALAIVAPLPPEDRPSHLLLELGTYYRLKGDLLARAGADGTLVATPASVPWWERTEDVLVDAAGLDRAVNEANRRRESARGRRPEDVPDVGNWEIHQQLGRVRLLLGRPEDALEAFRAARHLAPNNPAAHVDLARAEIAAGLGDRAAVSLLRALALEPGRTDAGRLLADVYRRIDGDGCALRAGARPNPACPLVRGHLCAAYGGLVALYRDLNEEARAEPFRAGAVRAYGCGPEAFRSLPP